MLEQETEHILRTLIERTIGPRQEITLNEALSQNMPRAIRSYLQAEVMQWLRDDLRSAPHFARAFDRAGGLGSLTKAFLRTLAEHYRFTREEYLGILENGVHFVENYLCRPRWTLDSFILENQPDVSPETVATKLGYLNDYAYFRDLIERFARGREGKSIPAEEFRTLIANIDDQVLKQHSPRELALLARPIFEFLLLSEEPAGGAIPVAALLVFFDDKKMTILREYIESVCHIRNRAALTLDELTALIEDLRLGASPPAREKAAEPLPVQQSSPADVWGENSPTAFSVETGPAPPLPPQHAEPPEPAKEPQVPEVVPREEASIPAPAEHARPLAAPPPHEEPAHPQEPASREKQNIPLSLTSAGLKAPAHEPQPLPDLNKIIPDDQRERFLKKIFHKDAKYYAGVIASLNKTRTWKEASLYLNRLYQVNKFDPFEKEIIEFTDAIQKRFGGPAGKHA